MFCRCECYNLHMHLGVVSRRVRKAAVVVMAAVASFVAVARGAELCLCDEDPDDCGQVCHECGVPVPDGVSESEDCLHLDVSAADLALADNDVRLPVVWFAPVAIPPDVHFAAFECEVLPRATGPPLECPVFCRYSIRLFPRS